MSETRGASVQDVIAGVAHEGIARDGAPGAALRTFLGADPLPIDTSLRIAADVADILDALHGAGVVHQRVSPDTIIVHESPWRVSVGGFSHATRLPRHPQAAVAPASFDASLTYFSPEQTGRINRSLDFRGDLYSLGVVLYEMLVGQPPFTAADPLQLIHAHVARAPTPPDRLRPTLPPMVCEVVMRLLSKSADDRYASAAGVEHDLRLCLAAQRLGRQGERFELGAADRSSRFQLPERLYGREAEVARLIAAFERVSAGRPSVLLVKGYSGVGKSSLVREVHRPVLERHGYFADGKFDQYKRNVPFSSVHAALRTLLRQVLAEEPARIADHRGRVLEAAGANAQLLAEAVPELARLIGPQPVPPELPALESRNRFQRTLREVVGAFCSAAQPLCLFLDDLQWVDGATLDWLETLLTDRAAGHLFLIGAYRDHEVTAAHPLAMLLGRLRDAGLAVDEIALGPLDAPTVGMLVADTLRATATEVEPLSRLVHARTGGNAFHVAQLLDALHEEGAIALDPATRRWTWDEQRAARADASENVVDFVTARLQRLPAEAQRILHTAACLGSQFTRASLVSVSELDAASVDRWVPRLVVDGILVDAHDAGEVLRFLHDRVQQASYGLRPAFETRAMRLRIGRRLLHATEHPESSDTLFDILQHLNAAADEITGADEQRRVAELNLVAAARARASAAYLPAQAFVQSAREIAGRGGIDASGPFAFRLALELAECAHALADDTAARAGYQRALELAADDFARGLVYERKIHFHTNRAEFRDAFSTGLEAAAMFGIELPKSFVPPLFLAEYARARVRLRGRDIPALAGGPALTEPRRLLAMQFMGSVAKAGFQIRPELCIHICTRIVNESLAHGNAPDSVIGYLAFGVIFSGAILGNPKAGYDYGRLSLALVDQFDNHAKRAEANFVYGYFAHGWARPFASVEPYFRTAYQAGIDTGDHFHAGCACVGLMQNLWIRGATLASVVDEADRLELFLQSIDGAEPLGVVRAVRQGARSLAGPGGDPRSTTDDPFDEAALVAALPGFGSPHFAHVYWTTRLQAMVLRRRPEEARAAAQESAKYLAGSRGLQQVAEHTFWNALACSQAGDSSAPRVLRAAARRFARWSRGCAPNFAPRRLLLLGELSRIAGHVEEAAPLFERAAEEARAAGQPQYEALAGELAGEALVAAGRGRVGHWHLRAAHDAWRRWGAAALADAVVARHPDAFAEAAGGEAAPSLDLQTVIRSALAISGATQLSTLLATLLDAMRENAGAERAVVLLRGEGGFTVQAEGRVGEPASLQAGTPLAECVQLPRSLVNLAINAAESLVLGDASRDSLWVADPYVRAHAPRSVLCAPIVRRGEVVGVIYLENNAMPGAFTADRLEVVSVLSAQIAISLDNAQLVDRLEEKVRARTEQLESRNQFIRRTFGRFLSDDVVDSLLDTSAGSHLGGEKRTVTIMMADLRGFSTMAEALPPETVMAVINNYLGAMTEVIMAHQGTIDEFIGDAILAIFGAPVHRDDDAERAVACAIAMQRAMDGVNERNVRDGLPVVAMGIGLDTGEVVVGSIGSEKRAKYGVVGSTVNMASRIEGYTMPGQVLISHRTRGAVPVPLDVEQELVVQPKGSREPMTLHDVVGIGGKWSLALKRSAPITASLATPIPVRYAAMRGKDVEGDGRDARITALSDSLTTALLAGAPGLAALENVWLRLADGDVAFAKVSSVSPDGALLRITSLGEASAAVLRAGLQGR